MSLLKSELGAFFGAVSLQASCAFLWDPGKKLINDRLLFQQSIYFPHCFALITVGTEWFTSGVFSGGGGYSTCIFQHFMFCPEPSAAEFQWSRCTRSEITPWALVICVVSGFISVCKKCFSSSAWGSLCVLLEVLQIQQGWEALRGHPALDCIIWVQPSSFAALMFDKCIALYHQTLLCFCAKIFHFCSPLSLIDNALRGFYLL